MVLVKELSFKKPSLHVEMWSVRACNLVLHK